MGIGRPTEGRGVVGVAQIGRWQGAGLMGDNRIKGLDGLRAAACVAVVGHHASVPGLGRTGWLGVDVFFVLSGYLITRLLLGEQERTGRIRLGAFYLRRLARLYPALLVTIAGTTTCALMAGSDPRDVATAAGLAAGYLADLPAAVPLLGGMHIGHAWSLAVEEQFYMLWPLALLAIRTRPRLTLAAGAGAVASLAAMASGTGTVLGLPNAYFTPHTRAWELLAGCALAASGARLGSRAAPWLGITLIACGGATAHFLGRDTAPATAAAAAIVVTGTLVLLASIDRAPSVLSLPVAEWIGQRSYGLYLYHAPLLAAAAATDARWLVRTPAALAAALLVTAASHRWIEMPVRSRAAILTGRARPARAGRAPRRQEMTV